MTRYTQTVIVCDRCKSDIKAEGKQHEDWAVFSIRDQKDMNKNGEFCEMCKIEFEVWYEEVPKREKASDYKGKS